MDVIHPNTLPTIAALAAQGFSDSEIAEEVGLTRGQVQYLRSRERIQAALPGGGAGRWISTRRRTHAWDDEPVAKVAV